MVSVVVPVYNAERYLEKCIESILHQTYPVWELILVDNGSGDDSLRVCQEYAKKDERILVLHQYRNQGVSAARNLGLEKATGNYITFLDADDWVAPDYLKQLVETAKRTQADMLVCQYKRVYDKDRMSEETARQEVTWEHKIYDKKTYVKQCFLEGCTHCWGVLYKASLVERNRFPMGLTIGEDVLFLIDVILSAEKIVVTAYDGYRYYINENGTMKQKFTGSYMDQIICWEKAKEKLMDPYPETEKRIDSILLVSAVLVAGKLSALSEAERKGYLQELKDCEKVIRKLGKQKEIIKLLPAGYPLKVKIFTCSPKLYMYLYGVWKR